MYIGTSTWHVCSFVRNSQVYIFWLLDAINTKLFHNSADCISCTYFSHASNFTLFILTLSINDLPFIIIANSPLFCSYNRILFSHGGLNYLIKLKIIEQCLILIFSEFYIWYKSPIEFINIVYHKRMFIAHLLKLIYNVCGMKGRSILFDLYIQILRCFRILYFEKFLLMQLFRWSKFNLLLWIFIINFFRTLGTMLLYFFDWTL